MIRKIVKLGDETLRKQSKPMQKFDLRLWLLLLRRLLNRRGRHSRRVGWRLVVGCVRSDDCLFLFQLPQECDNNVTNRRQILVQILLAGLF